MMTKTTTITLVDYRQGWRRGVDDEDETDYNWSSQYLPNFLEALRWSLRYICMELHKSFYLLISSKLLTLLNPHGSNCQSN